MFLMYTKWEIIRIPAVFQLSARQEDEICTQLAAADVIFSQRVTDDFPVPYLRTSAIKARFPTVLSWPNIYFAGYFPDVQYIYLDKIGKVVGPLEDYHLRLIHHYYTQGKTVHESELLYTTDRFNAYYPDPFNASLAELQSREKDLDLQIAPTIADVVRSRKAFFTVNHPSNRVLFEMMRIMLASQGADFQIPVLHPYALARINIPIYPMVRHRNGLDHLPEGSFVGIGRLNNNAKIEDAPPKVYEDWSELIISFYRFYDTVYSKNNAPI